MHVLLFAKTGVCILSIGQTFACPFAGILNRCFLEFTRVVPNFYDVFRFEEITKQIVTELFGHFGYDLVAFINRLAFKVFKKLEVKILWLLYYLCWLQNLVELGLAEKKKQDAVILKMLSGALVLQRWHLYHISENKI